jgi:hypothetical protein
VPGPGFADVLSDELKVMERDGLDWFKQVRDPTFHRQHSFIARGLYAIQLKRWFDYFPRENFTIVKSEDFYANPDALTREVLSFIGVDPSTYSLAEFRNYNPGRYESKVPDDVRAHLLEFYRPHNQELARLLRMNFSDWDQ